MALAVAALLLAVVLGGSTGAARAASPAWVLRQVATPPLSLDSEIVAVAALDADTAWVCGTNDSVYLSRDGGRTWTAEHTGAPAGAAWRSIWFVDDLHGAVAGADGPTGLVYATSDGGLTWTERLRLPGTPLRGLAFWGAELGWVVGDSGTVCATVDGGATWAPQRSTTGVTLRAVSFAGLDRGLAAGDAGTLDRTHVGGTVWTQVRSHTTRRLLDIAYVSRSVGYAGGRRGVIVKTVNWGHHWDRLAAPAKGADCVAVAFATERRGLVALADARLLQTVDGGRHWRILKKGLGRLGDLRDVAFATPPAGTTSEAEASRAAADASAWIAGAHGVCLFARAGTQALNGHRR